MLYEVITGLEGPDGQIQILFGCHAPHHSDHQRLGPHTPLGTQGFAASRRVEQGGVDPAGDHIDPAHALALQLIRQGPGRRQTDLALVVKAPQIGLDRLLQPALV